MADLFENIAPSWVTNHLYQLGDVVLYNKKLYQCTDKHTSSSEIDLEKFKSHTLADMVAGTTQLENFADMTVVSDVVTSDETYTYLEMPNNGVVSDKTKIATLNSNLGGGSVRFNIGGFGYTGNHDWQRYTSSRNITGYHNAVISNAKFRKYDINVMIARDANKWMAVQVYLTLADGSNKYLLNNTYSDSAGGPGWLNFKGSTDSDITNLTIYMEETYGRAWIGDANATFSN